MARDTIGIVLGADLNPTVQMRWGAGLAVARRADLVVYQVTADDEAGTTTIDLAQPPDGDEGQVARTVLQAIQGLAELTVAPRDEDDPEPADDEPLRVTLRRIRFAGPRSLRQLLLTDVQKSKLRLLTAPRAALGTDDPDLVRERRLFLRSVPCEVVYCFGLREDTDFSRILVGIASGANAGAALRLGHDLARAQDGSLTVLRVNPHVGPDSERVGRRRVDDRLRKELGSAPEGVRQRVVVDDQPHRAIRGVWDEGAHDLIILGAPRSGFGGDRIGSGLGAKLMKAENKPAIAVVAAGSALKNRFFGLTEGLVERVVPQIHRDDRIALVDRIQSSSHWDFDFIALMVLSTFIAAIGLMQNSAAVVIGAMLVAPLMTPILGMGLSLVQGNPVLARISVRTIAFGVAVALAVGALVGLVTPGFDEPTREMLGRGGPSILDLFVAFASGLAAAYASSRPGLLAALPGVAIAAALVPPIATSGLALSLGNLDLAFNALLLFVINMVTIVLASMTSLWAVGLRSIKRAASWSLFVGYAVVVAVLALGVYLSVRPDHHAATRGLPPTLTGNIQAALGQEYRLDGFAVAYDELGVQLMVRVEGTEHVRQGLAEEIRALARGHFDVPVRVRLVSDVDAAAMP